MPKRRHGEEIRRRILLEARQPGARLAEILERYNVPERTYHHWRRAAEHSSVDAERVIRTLRREARLHAKQIERLEQELRLAKDMLGKPWRRQPPDGLPSGG